VTQSGPPARAATVRCAAGRLVDLTGNQLAARRHRHDQQGPVSDVLKIGAAHVEVDQHRGRSVFRDPQGRPGDKVRHHPAPLAVGFQPVEVPDRNARPKGCNGPGHGIDDQKVPPHFGRQVLPHPLAPCGHDQTPVLQVHAIGVLQRLAFGKDRPRAVRQDMDPVRKDVRHMDPPRVIHRRIVENDVTLDRKGPRDLSAFEIDGDKPVDVADVKGGAVADQALGGVKPGDPGCLHHLPVGAYSRDDSVSVLGQHVPADAGDIKHVPARIENDALGHAQPVQRPDGLLCRRHRATSESGQDDEGARIDLLHLSLQPVDPTFASGLTHDVRFTRRCRLPRSWLGPEKRALPS